MAAAPGPPVRQPAAAGSFYPVDAVALAEAVDALLRHALAQENIATRVRPLRALVVPHAGYRYSGPVAAKAYATLRRGSVDRAVLIGPAHFVRPAGCAVPQTAHWRTPLGVMPIDIGARDRALHLAGVRADDEPHAPEHALEVQLPFLQRSVAADLPVLPVAVHGPPETTADLLDAVAPDASTLVVASTDLSHYLPRAAAYERDTRTAAAVLDLRADLIDDRSACGAHALRGLLAWARRHGLSAHLLALDTSAAAGGDPTRVVGYGAFALA